MDVMGGCGGSDHERPFIAKASASRQSGPAYRPEAGLSGGLSDHDARNQSIAIRKSWNRSITQCLALFSWSGPPKIAMDFATRIPVSPQNVAAWVDSSGCSSDDGSRKIKRSKFASAQDKAVQIAGGIYQTRRGTAVKACDIATRLDRANRAEYSGPRFECTRENRYS